MVADAFQKQVCADFQAPLSTYTPTSTIYFGAKHLFTFYVLTWMLWLWILCSFCICRHRTMHQKVPSSGPCKNNATRIKLVLSLWICNRIHTLRSQPGHIHLTSGSESESISQSEPAHLGSPPDALDDMLGALHTCFGRRCSGDCMSDSERCIGIGKRRSPAVELMLLGMSLWFAVLAVIAVDSSSVSDASTPVLGPTDDAKSDIGTSSPEV